MLNNAPPLPNHVVSSPIVSLTAKSVPPYRSWCKGHAADHRGRWCRKMSTIVSTTGTMGA